VAAVILDVEVVSCLAAIQCDVDRAQGGKQLGYGGRAVTASNECIRYEREHIFISVPFRGSGRFGAIQRSDWRRAESSDHVTGADSSSAASGGEVKRLRGQTQSPDHTHTPITSPSPCTITSRVFDPVPRQSGTKQFGLGNTAPRRHPPERPLDRARVERHQGGYQSTT